MLNAGLLFLIVALLINPITSDANSVAPRGVVVSQACEPTETWIFPESLIESFNTSNTGSAGVAGNAGEFQKWTSEFQMFTSGKASPQRGLGEGLALLRILSMRPGSESETQVALEFAKYWIARSFYLMHFDHLAHLGFGKILKGHVSGAAPIRQAALKCMGMIKTRVTALKFPALVNVNKDSIDPQGQNGRAVSQWLKDGFKDEFKGEFKGESQVRELLREVERRSVAGNRFPFIHALADAKANNPAKVIRSLAELNLSKGSLRSQSEQDAASILLARSYYALGAYDTASVEFQKVSKNSNELPRVLTELSWTYLMAGQYSRAVGISHQLRSGGLKRTFVPEALMVSAMAYNELCEYPLALASLELFKKDYAAIYSWLKQPTVPSSEYYRIAVGYLQGKQGKPEIPEKIMSEWIRSPLFQSYQEEINQLLGVSPRWKTQTKDARTEANLMRKNLILELRDFLKAERLARVRLAMGEELPAVIYNLAETCRSNLRHYQRYRLGITTTRAAVSNFAKNIPNLRNDRIARINAHFGEQNTRMLTLLEEIAENNQLIATEVYSGASRDLVWKNAHPEQSHLIELRKKISGQSTGSSWSWGLVRASDLEGAELWEDEVGFAQARLQDGCRGAEEARL